MDSQSIASVARRANAIGAKCGVFCTYKMDAPGKFVWIFYRETERGNVRLGKTANPDKVTKMMEQYCTCIP